MFNEAKKVLIIAHADVSGNPRPRRIIELFKGQGYLVDVVGYALRGDKFFDKHFVLETPALSFLSKVLRKLIGMWSVILPLDFVKNYLNEVRWGYNKLPVSLLKNNYNVIVSEDLYPLPYVFKIKGHAKVVFDAREFYPEEFGHSALWRLTERPMRLDICNRYLDKCDLVMTVSEGIAQRYEKDFSVSPILVRSMPSFNNLEPTRMQTNRIRMVHHGIANQDRRLENLIDIVDLLDDRFELDFYLTGVTEYIDTLKLRAKNNKKIRFFAPIPFQQIIQTINKYDVGFCYIEPTTFNLEQCLPNKFFEYIQGRVALMVGPSEQMAPIVRAYNCGFVAPQFETKSTAEFLNNISNEEFENAKKASSLAAHDLCYDKESRKILTKLGL
jgi:hypothetical protein